MKNYKKKDTGLEKELTPSKEQNQSLVQVKYVRKIEQKVLNFIQNENLIQKNDHVLIALSGGPDSVFLLHLLDKFKNKLAIKIAAFHLNHSLRGSQADSDMQFCKDLCSRLSVEIFAIKKNIKLFAEKNKYSLEEAGRIARYEALNKISAGNGYNKIATGHNLNDNTETVLLNLFKGSGISGITGIPITRGNIIRPILNLSKQDILTYLKFKNISFRTDLTNKDEAFERNFLREGIIPVIKQKLNPSLDESIFRSSQILRKVNSFLLNYISLSMNNIVSKEYNYIRVDLAKLKELDGSLHDIFYRELFNRTGEEFSYKDISSTAGLLKKKTGTSLTLSNNYSAIKNRSFISLKKGSAGQNEEQVTFFVGQNINFNGCQIIIDEFNERPSVYPKNGLVEYINGDNLKDEFTVRYWMPGDKFKPLGMNGEKNVSDFLNDLKINPVEKKTIPVLLNNNKIIWIPGYRISNDVKIKKETKKIFKLCLLTRKK